MVMNVALGAVQVGGEPRGGLRLCPVIERINVDLPPTVLHGRFKAFDDALALTSLEANAVLNYFQ